MRGAFQVTNHAEAAKWFMRAAVYGFSHAQKAIGYCYETGKGVGMDAGKKRVLGEFAVHAADGTKLTAFTARKSYLGGQGIGGWDMMKIEDLVDQLGQLAAETTDKWVRGEIVK